LKNQSSSFHRKTSMFFECRVVEFLSTVYFSFTQSGNTLVQGTMLIEINGASKLPVALEMNQGCPPSDAWLLMRRLKSFSSSLTPQHSSMGPIDISP